MSTSKQYEVEHNLCTYLYYISWYGSTHSCSGTHTKYREIPPFRFKSDKEKSNDFIKFKVKILHFLN